MKNFSRSVLAILNGGLVMWFLAGIWHNLVLPALDKNIHPHHKGLFIGLLGYLVLAVLMGYLYSELIRYAPHRGVIPTGRKIGIITGILWVFPHGLVMAGIHETSLLYEVKNTLWHLVEQGLGGIIIALVMQRERLFKFLPY